MKYKQFVNELKNQGVVFVEMTNHTKLYYKGKHSTLKRHPSQEISNQYANLIRKNWDLSSYLRSEISPQMLRFYGVLLWQIVVIKLP